MRKKYTFISWSDRVTVEIPELDKLMADLRQLGKKYRLGFRLLGGDSEWHDAKIVIVPFADADWNIFVDGLEHYSRGVLFLDKAKEFFLQARANEDRKRHEAEALEKNKHNLAWEEKFKADGIWLSDGFYRVVKAES